MRRLAALIAMALLAGCTQLSTCADLVAGRSGTASSASATVAVAYPRFDDSDPHEWESGAPWHYAVHGTDVSKYQTSVDWHEAKASGISFAFIKATEGGDRVDDNFSENWQRRQGGRRAARRLSFLLFLPAGRRAGALVHPQRAARPFVACRRCSTWSGTRIRRPASCGPPPRRCAARCASSWRWSRSHYGKKPIIYTSVDFFDDNDLSTLPRLSLLAALGRRPSDRQIRRPPLHLLAVHRHRRGARHPGNADINVFNGSQSRLEKVVEARTRNNRLNARRPHFATGGLHWHCAEAWASSGRSLPAGYRSIRRTRGRDGGSGLRRLQFRLSLHRRGRRWRSRMRRRFRRLEDGLRAEAEQAGVGRQGLAGAGRCAQIDPKVLKRDRAQGVFAQTFVEFSEPHGQRLPPEAGCGQSEEIRRRVCARRGRSSACRRRSSPPSGRWRPISAPCRAISTR